MNDSMIDSLLCLWCVQDVANCCMNCDLNKEPYNEPKKNKKSKKQKYSKSPKDIEMSRELIF